jgi:hypothetical protein
MNGGMSSSAVNRSATNDPDDEHHRLEQCRPMGGAAASRAGPDYQPRHRRSLLRSILAGTAPLSEQRMFAKLIDPGFLADMRPLLAAAQAEGLTDETMKAAFSKVFSQFVVLLPGEAWARSEDMKERFQILL